MNRELIKLIRQSLRMNQHQFSSKLGISRSQLALVEAGYIEPSRELIEKIRQLVGDDYIQRVKNILVWGEEKVGS
ncbi:helix-turn-helix domain-containing protein [Caldibacillus debilis]|jgi:transcriptional regulator with XRE-family HTH domain|uniref:helix-turn-helix domain-containing protein n=1 Tax=Caldibacillus debilis TaxID=301148 RepID=UPI000779588E|nr:helix-turn-helix transcriptional regulator [Caldibacillus debilis]